MDRNGDRTDAPPPPAPAAPAAPADVAAAWAAGQDETAWLTLVARHTDDAVAVSGLDGRLLWVNDVFERMSGFALAECVGRRRVDLIRGPFTRTSQFAELASQLARLEPTEVEFATRTKAGAAYWTAMTVRPLVQDGQVVGLIGVERDVTDRRTAQERARQTLARAESLAVALRYEKTLLTRVVGTIPHMVWWKNADLRYVGANAAFLALRGLQSQAEVVGRLEGQLDVSDDLGHQLALLEAAVSDTGEATADVPVTLTTSDGTTRTVLLSVLPNTEGGRFAGVIGIGADVSRVKELERQLAQAGGRPPSPRRPPSDEAVLEPSAVRRRLTEALAAVDPDGVAARVPDALAASLTGLEQVTELVRELRELTLGTSGPRPVALNTLVETIVEAARPAWSARAGVDVEVVLDPAVGQLPGLENDLRQAVHDVLMRAVQDVERRRRRDGTDSGGRVVVRTVQVTPQEVCVTVQDDGIGLDDATVRRLLEAAGRPGVATGLAAAHQVVVELHGGRFDLSSRLGRGSVVTMTLPTGR